MKKFTSLSSAEKINYFLAYVISSTAVVELMCSIINVEIKKSI
jgi:hypothetical protein|tara:strand:+ start:587 stop:715 length:129 start_codon:yes stop_codon:yes gene_type:complete